MIAQLRPALVGIILFTLLTGLIYPLLVTAAAQALFPKRARGSLIQTNKGLVGSALVGQEFTEPTYFWGRPSVTTPPYNAASSGGSNLGPLNPDLAKAVQARVDNLQKADPGNTAPIPIDLVTASASGLDPHISPAAALYQVPRVARARELNEIAVKNLVNNFIERRQLGILGEPRVNVLKLNLALDQLKK